MTDTSEKGVRVLSTVLHALRLLDLIADSDRPLRLAEVAARSGLGRATAYQRLLTLVEAGFLETDQDGRYRLTLYPARLAQAALAQSGIGTRADAVMGELMQLTGETVSFAVLDRCRPCIVARVETNLLLRADLKIGSYLSLEGSASGRVLAAFASPRERQMLEASGYELPSDAILAGTRAEGFAISSGYSMNGVRAVAAPVFAADGHCLGALSLVVPEQRYQLDAILEPLRQAARRLTATFQGGKP